MPGKKKIQSGNRCANCDSLEGDSQSRYPACSRCKLVYYCSKECQVYHWKGGHKAECIAVADRKPETVAAAEQGSQVDLSPSSNERCAICLLAVSKYTGCNLPCKHEFHTTCILDLRLSGGAQVCPLCRADLPPNSLHRLFIEGCHSYFTLADHVKSGRGTWDGYKKEVAEVIRKWELAAAEGDSNAQSNLGIIYNSGQGVPVNIKKAVEWYNKAAENGNVNAMSNLVPFYTSGMGGVPKDTKKAFELALKAAEKGHSIAQFKVAMLYNDGIGVKTSYEKAYYWVKKSADSGFIDAPCLLADCYIEGKGVAKNHKKVREAYERGVELGDPICMLHLGTMYKEGIFGAKKDYTKAMQFFQKAAACDMQGAQTEIGKMYFDGEGVKQNYKIAHEWFQKAAVIRTQNYTREGCLGTGDDDLFNKGKPLPDTYDFLGNMYLYGHGVKKNYDKAFEYYQLGADQQHTNCLHVMSDMYQDGQGPGRVVNDKRSGVVLKIAADLGYMPSQVNMGIAYLYGKRGMLKNLNLSAKYFKLAAAKGSAQSAYNLGCFYSNESFGFDTDAKLAFQYYSQGAHGGHPEAQFQLGQIYFNGIEGVCERDVAEAFEWFEKAAAAGNENAMMFSVKMRMEMFAQRQNNKN